MDFATAPSPNPSSLASADGPYQTATNPYLHDFNPNAGIMSLLPNLIKPDNRFDDEAASWDLNPFVRKSSQQALATILSHYPQLQCYRDGRTDNSEGIFTMIKPCFP